MKRGIMSLIIQDCILAWRNGLVLVTGITLVVIIGLYWIFPLLLPAGISLSESQVILDNTNDKSVTKYLLANNADEDMFVKDRTELEKRVKKADGSIGIIIEGNRDKLKFTMVFRNKPADRTVHILKAVLRRISGHITGEEFGSDYKINMLRTRADPIPVNKKMIVVLLTFEVIILGFLFVAIIIFGEKKEGSVKAYRVSPSGLINYVVSKTIVFTVLSVLYGLVLVLCTLGPGKDFLHISLVLFAACGLMTMLGLGVAVFFNNISEWFAAGVLMLSINMLAIIPYNIPVFSNPIFSYVPGYTVIFGLSEILFPTGKTGFLLPLYITLVIQLAIGAMFCFFAAYNKIMKEG